MLMHETEVIEYGPRKGTHDVIRYVCVSGHPTPEKSTWKLEEVTCKNCLRELKTILHKKDWRGKRKAIYNGQLHDEILDQTSYYFDVKDNDEWGLSTFCTECYLNEGSTLCVALDRCIYKQLVTKMMNGMLDCPDCGGEKELLETLSWWQDNTLFGIIPQLPTLEHEYVYRCKKCRLLWIDENPI
jgi:hypothetical protein